MKILFLITINLIAITLLSQGVSNIYNKKGKLLLDTSFSITEKQLNKWRRHETHFLYYISKNIEYPVMLREAGITGFAILSFDCDTTNSIKNITILSKSNILFGQAAIKGLQKSEKILTSFLKNKSGLTETFYIPVVFNLFDFEDKINYHKALPVSTAILPPLSIDIYCPGVGKKNDVKNQ